MLAVVEFKRPCQDAVDHVADTMRDADVAEIMASHGHTPRQALMGGWDKSNFSTMTYIDDEPVVMFALEWCEFCWSVRRMFADYNIPYRSVDLDSVDYQNDDWGGKIRGALAARTSWTTIPQIFVGGEFIGGCTDAFDAWKEGRLQALLEDNGVAYAKDKDADPYSFLPTWLHPR